MTTISEIAFQLTNAYFLENVIAESNYKAIPRFNDLSTTL
jgi:hypothetical protein